MAKTKYTYALPNRNSCSSWTSEEWALKTVADLIDDKKLEDFITDWDSDLQKGPRKTRYLEYILSASGHAKDVRLSPEVLTHVLWKTVDSVAQEPAEIKNPVAAYEMVSSMANFSKLASNGYNKKEKAVIENAYTAVHGSVIIFAHQALNSHFENLGKG